MQTKLQKSAHGYLQSSFRRLPKEILFVISSVPPVEHNVAQINKVIHLSRHFYTKFGR